jgi:hypothetical protein
MSRFGFLPSLAMASVAVFSSQASAIEINFQELPLSAGTPVTGQYAAKNVRFDGFYFSNDPAISIDGFGIYSFTGNVHSPGPNPVSYVNFINPVTNLSIDYGKIGALPGGFVEWDAIDGSGNLVGLQSITGGAAVNITYNAGPLVIKSLIFSASASGDGYITGLRFDPLRSAVPEPSSWAMMIVGFGIVGGCLRRKENVMAIIRNS